jgi:hypothetical protein
MRTTKRPLGRSIVLGCIQFTAILCLTLSVLNFFNQLNTLYRRYEAYIGDILTNKTTTIHETDVGRVQVRNDNLEDQYYIDNHHDALVGRVLWEKIGQMINDQRLAGQKNFDGIEEVRKLAKRDRMLDEVRVYLPRKPGRWVALRERRLSAGLEKMKGAAKC